MTSASRTRSPAVATLLLALLAAAAAEGAEWPQWGGPERTFEAPGPAIAHPWPEAGPSVAWRRPLGEGYSGIAVAGGVLYTLYREGDQEVVVALEARSGEERWRHTIQAPLSDRRRPAGPGPFSTPLVIGKRLVVAASNGELRALDLADGRLLWRHALAGETRESYSSSPLALGDFVLIQAFEPQAGVVALAVADGKVAWRSESLTPTFASLARGSEETHAELLLFGRDVIAGLEPTDGSVLWKQPYSNENGANILTPLVAPDGTVIVSGGPDKGSLALRVSDGSEGLRIEERWSSAQLRFFHNNALLRGDTLYGTSGGIVSAVLTAADVASGEILWRDRRVGRSNLLGVGATTLAWTDQGELYLLALSRDGLEVLASAPILDGECWTAPALAGDLLFVRNRKEIAAVRLPREEAAAPLEKVTATESGRR